MDDPRKARTLDEAALNQDGKTYNAFKALSWLSEAVSPGRGVTEDEVRRIYDDVKKRRTQQ